MVLRPLWAIAASVAAACALSSPAQAEEGLVALFNGKDFTGWVVEGARQGKKDQKPIWSVQNEMIHATGDGFGFLRYDKPVSDFIFEVEYRMAVRCNSGIGIRGVKYEGKPNTRPSYASYEVQILDDAGKPPSAQTSGSLYRYVAPKVNAARPAGQWNKMRIECRGPRIRVTLNDQVLHDLDQTQFAALKAKPLSGYVMLQSHSRGIDFRNPRLQELKPETR